MDDEHTYVKGYVRRKHAEGEEPPKLSRKTHIALILAAGSLLVGAVIMIPKFGWWTLIWLPIGTGIIFIFWRWFLAEY